MFYLYIIDFLAAYDLDPEANHKVRKFHVPSSKSLSVSESNLPQPMPAHESALVNVAVYTIQSALTGILRTFRKSLHRAVQGSRLVYWAIISL